MAFLFPSSYDMPELAPLTCIYSKAMSLFYNLLTRICDETELSFGKFNGRYGDLIQQHSAPLSRMLNDNLVQDIYNGTLHLSYIM